MIKEDYIGEFDTWGDAEDYFKKEVQEPPHNHTSGCGNDRDCDEPQNFEEWCEENYNLNPRFTVKSDRKTAESDAINYQTIHQS